MSGTFYAVFTLSVGLNKLVDRRDAVMRDEAMVGQLVATSSVMNLSLGPHNAAYRVETRTRSSLIIGTRCDECVIAADIDEL